MIEPVPENFVKLTRKHLRCMPKETPLQVFSSDFCERTPIF